MQATIFETISRNGAIGKELQKYTQEYSKIPNNLIIEALKHILFKENYDKFIMTNFNQTYEEVSII